MGGGGGVPTVKFLGSFKKLLVEDHMNQDLTLKNVFPNLQIWAHLRA